MCLLRLQGSRGAEGRHIRNQINITADAAYNMSEGQLWHIRLSTYVFAGCVEQEASGQGRFPPPVSHRFCCSQRDQRRCVHHAHHAGVLHDSGQPVGRGLARRHAVWRSWSQKKKSEKHWRSIHRD